MGQHHQREIRVRPGGDEGDEVPVGIVPEVPGGIRHPQLRGHLRGGKLFFLPRGGVAHAAEGQQPFAGFAEADARRLFDVQPLQERGFLLLPEEEAGALAVVGAQAAEGVDVRLVLAGLPFGIGLVRYPQGLRHLLLGETPAFPGFRQVFEKSCLVHKRVSS